MYNKVNRNPSDLKRLSARSQRKRLLKPKIPKQVRINKRKSILSRTNPNKLHKGKKMMQVNTGSSSPEIFVPYESTDKENDSEADECIFVDNKEKGGVIVIDDDDDNINGAPPTTTGNIWAEDVILINSQTSINRSDFHESKTNTATKSSHSSNSTAGSSTQSQKDLKLSSYSLKTLLPSKIAENYLFYTDTTPGLDTSSPPLYTVEPPDDSVILVDSISESVKKQSIAENVDDSVIFMGEEILLHDHHSQQAALNYIPLSNYNNESGITPLKRKSSTVIDKVIQPFKKFKSHLSSLCQSTSTPKNKHDLLTLTEQKKNQLYNSNVYNPSKEAAAKTGKRMVIIDGSNVAFGHSLNKEFSVKGLEFCLEYFIKKGHEVKAVVPQFRLQKNKSTNPERLEELHKEGRIVFTPCKNLPGKSTTSYDDRFILQLAVEFDAAVVSNDNYRDLLSENPAFKKIIENRVIGYTWCKDMFLLPKDPYGRLGPTLSVILNH